MIINNLLIVLLFSTTTITSITGNPIEGANDHNNGHQSADTDTDQWSSVPEVDQSSMMEMFNSIMEMIRSQLSGWMYGARSNDEVEVDSSNREFMPMVHGLFSRLSNMAIDMMGQMRRMRDKPTADRLQDSSSSSGESDSTNGSTNSSTLATRLRDRMEDTKERIKGAWNDLMQKYNSTMGSISSAISSSSSSSSSSSAMTSNLQGEDLHLIDDETKANLNLKSDNRRVIRSLDTKGDGGKFEIVKSSYINSVEPKVFDKLISMVDQQRVNHQSKQFDLLVGSPVNEDSGQTRNLFDRMRGAMDSARSKFLGTIGKFMNGTMMTDPEDDDSINLTENDNKNWWQRFKPKGTSNPTKIPERESLNPRGSPSYPPSSTIPKETIPTIRRANYPESTSLPPYNRPAIDWTVRSHPKVIPRTESKVDLDTGEPDEPSRATIEFMEKFKEEIESIKSSMEPNQNDNLEMAMTKVANWGLFVRSISESKNLDDFWSKISQQAN